ncbi:MAG: hypothetical protein KF846_11715 [Cyclobacteriaceae bacterium]|nr:hypothetical protein [Cyclobacteriaceae bacterium]
MGLDQELPKNQIVKGRDYLNSILQKYSEDTGIKGTEEIVQLADELSKLAVVIQAFAYNCLRVIPHPEAAVDVTDKTKYKYREARLMSLDEYRESKKYRDKIFKNLNKLDVINARLKSASDTLKSISVTLNLHSPIEEDGVDPEIDLTETLKLPHAIHYEFLMSLETLLEKYVGRVDMYKDLIARKDLDRRIIIEVTKESSATYLRDIFPDQKQATFPTKSEALIIAFVLVAAGILHGEKEYYKNPIGHGLTTANARPYISYLREEITHNTLQETRFEPRTLDYKPTLIDGILTKVPCEPYTIPANPNFYWGTTWLDFIHELA